MSTQTDTQFRLRLPAGLHARVKAASETNLRSINAEIVQALNAAFPSMPNPENVNREMLQALKGVRANLVRLAWEENTLMIEGLDAAIAKAEGRG